MAVRLALSPTSPLSTAMERALWGWSGPRTRAELTAAGVSLVTLRALVRRGLVVRVWAWLPLVAWRRRGG